ncbi:30S ribosomal protein S11 [Candidatus Cytomitobacter indipagum]|uniref:Small ribosomal subunit protein uS11 n=1 Tax=Candidatus Cytomitobacter indipagum TaxID=2601575 RepID=A0A5C0UDZ4_9PROT|nr:30S ribosomal protein S11 [Candidatus Cytomitobacter indipagum]QEK38248.1 30S ribosomal protein S11 [Candidatus Cytomitobacter indipagum]
MVRVTKRSKKEIHSHVMVHISSSSNNTIMTAFSDKTKAVVAWSSPGAVGFKGARKATPFASQAAAEDLSNKMDGFSVKSISIIFRGLGNGRDAALKTFQTRGFMVKTIADRTSFPFNGVRMRRRRRV